MDVVDMCVVLCTVMLKSICGCGGGEVCGVQYCGAGEGFCHHTSTSPPRLVVRNTLVTDVRVAARTFLRAWTEFIARLLQVREARKVWAGNKPNNIVKACFPFQAFSHSLSPDQCSVLTLSY